MTADLLLTGGDIIHIGRDQPPLAGGGIGHAGLTKAGGDTVHIGRADLAIAGGRIVAVEPDLARDAREVIDVSGKLVAPGLVDLHTHVASTGTYWGIDPDPVAWYTGVTTWVDAGSMGAYTFSGLPVRDVRVVALLNISAIGLTAAVGESRDLANCDVDLAIATVLAHPDRIKGVKVRMDRHNVTGLEPLRRAIEVGQACGLPVMVHIGAAPPGLGEILPLLRPGDIITHCASGIAAGRRGLDPAFKEAYAAGVRFDIGHGSGGFAFDVIEAQLEAGMPPHTISSDLHGRCLYGPVFDLPTTMAKLLAIGLSLEQVMLAATRRPAEALGLDAGTLAVGAPADIAVFSVQAGRFALSDAHGQVRHSPLRLRNELTLVAGKPLPPKLPEAPKPWIPLNDAQRAALRRRQQAVRDLLSTPLVGPEDLDEQFPRHS